ncbi:recombinase family protein [Chryseobacterium oncorhynchi]|uniref:Resolvase n=1 Tax=Chryseobacterium oncorhynchi TaxID=741074 RepID=A0A316WL38_9FLAO|nr:recombinase family protein [Chryseobacterium oncorhynchi]PWN59150.1 resolvase [Chryseobacterium oncorhynchi]
MTFGYARVSTTDQNLETQLNELKKLGVEKIFSEKISAKNLERVELKLLLSQLRPNDKVIVTKIDRLARSLKDLIFLLDEFSKKEIILQIGPTLFDFTTPEGRLFATLFGSVAQYERELINERTKAGLLAAREEGRVGGKPKGLSPLAKSKAKKAYELREKGLSISDIQKTLDIKSKRTLYSYIRYEVDNRSILEDKQKTEDGLWLLSGSENEKKTRVYFKSSENEKKSSENEKKG